MLTTSCGWNWSICWCKSAIRARTAACGQASGAGPGCAFPSTPGFLGPAGRGEVAVQVHTARVSRAWVWGQQAVRVQHGDEAPVHGRWLARVHRPSAAAMPIQRRASDAAVSSSPCMAPTTSTRSGSASGWPLAAAPACVGTSRQYSGAPGVTRHHWPATGWPRTARATAQASAAAAWCRRPRPPRAKGSATAPE